MPVWKQTYKGRGIYWHGKNRYGDETGVYAKSIKECCQLIDRLEKQQETLKSPALKYWDTLPHDMRERWRRLSIATELSAPELAYTNKLKN